MDDGSSTVEGNSANDVYQRLEGGKGGGEGEGEGREEGEEGGGSEEVHVCMYCISSALFLTITVREKHTLVIMDIIYTCIRTVHVYVHLLY